MGFEVQLQNRAFEDVPLPAGAMARVLRYGSRAVGGPSEAELEIAGAPESLAEALRWLRYGVMIRNSEGTPVWWGYIEGVEIVAGALWDRVSLQSMWNKVAVTYAYDDADGGWGRATTSYALDDESVARFGSKELIESLGDGEGSSATARRDKILSLAGKPVALPIVDSAQPGVRLFCRGWWDTLGWKYFQRLEGRIDNEGGNNESGLAFGWKLSASNQVHFWGATTTYTRTVSGATNATPIVVTTTVAHALKAGDTAVISGVLGNTAANGTFRVVGVTSTTFELTDLNTGNDIAGNGAYTSGGTVSVTLETNESAIVYGKKITGATNATPVVVTCANHGFANGAVVKISGIEGNNAANGEFKVASATTNTFALTDKLTSANVAGSGDYATGGVVVDATVVGPFDALKAGQILTVSGSTSNNVSYTVLQDGTDNGNSVSVSPSPTSEAAGASVTMALRGEQVAQSFIGMANFSAKRIALKLGKQGSPTDSVSVQLRNDSTGSVGGTVLASGSISNSLLSDSAEWVWVELGGAVALTAGTRYWIVVYRSSTVDAFNHYLVQFDGSIYETVRLWDGSAWQSDSGKCVLFRVWAVEDLLAQVKRMLTDSNQFNFALDVEGSHGVSSNQWRGGDRRALAEIEDLLATVGSNGRRLLATVNAQRSVQIYAEPVASEGDAILTRERSVRTPGGHPWQEGLLPVGRWLVRDGMPGGVDIMIQRAIFVEEAIFDAVAGTISQIRMRGSEEFFG